MIQLIPSSLNLSQFHFEFNFNLSLQLRVTALGLGRTLRFNHQAFTFKPAIPHLLELPFHAWHEHDAGDAHPQQHEEGIDEAGDGGVIATGAAPAQQTGGTATQAGDLKWGEEQSGSHSQRRK